MIIGLFALGLTFYPNERRILYLSQLARSHACIIGRFLNVFEHEDISANRQTVLRFEIFETFPPLDERHRRSAGDARYVQRRSGLYFVNRLERHGEVGRYTSHCAGKIDEISLSDQQMVEFTVQLKLRVNKTKNNYLGRAVWKRSIFPRRVNSQRHIRTFPDPLLHCSLSAANLFNKKRKRESNNSATRYVHQQIILQSRLFSAIMFISLYIIKKINPIEASTGKFTVQGDL